MILNEKQRVAVDCNDPAVFLMSGAGTGKTRVIISRVRQIIEKNDTNLKILILSFTKRSVYDLKTKLKYISDNLIITTFHGLCYSLISTNNNFSIFDEKFRSSLNLSDAELLEISTKKRLLDFSSTTTKPFYVYSSFLAKNELIDYTDLEILTLEKLKNKDGNVLELTSFDYIFIDEFQDTSPLQFELLKFLHRTKTQIFAVGDPDQSIYSFRGTGKDIIEQYIKYFHAKRLYLDMNYRCSSIILCHANKLISHNKNRFRKLLQGVKKQVGILKTYKVTSIEDEKSLVILNIRKLINIGYQQEDIAIIFRNYKDVVSIKAELFNHYLLNVNVISMHQSKGLEFKVVLIVGLNDRKFESKSILEEERRLLFVSMTRAMDQLYIYFYPKGLSAPKLLRECKIKYETLD